jgi:murein DD-endopeptidase MepM/ murein hydrolase activator NlpD
MVIVLVVVGVFLAVGAPASAGSVGGDSGVSGVSSAAAAARVAAADFAKSAAYPRWSWPVIGSHVIVRPFIAPATQYSAGHRGIDIAASGAVLAPANGVVHFRGVVVNRGVLSIDQGAGIISSFEPVTSTLAAGTVIVRGQVIGQIDAGHCAESCLHFGVRVNGQYVNPLLFLGGVVRPVLLPTIGAGAGS